MPSQIIWLFGEGNGLTLSFCNSAEIVDQPVSATGNKMQNIDLPLPIPSGAAISAELKNSIRTGQSNL